jgi:hypothetical protein
MKLLRKVTAVCVLAFMSKVAVAMPMDYTFEVNFIGGPLSGVTETVFVTIDGVTGAGIEDFFPTSLTRPMLSFDFMFGGVAFAMTDEVDYPSFPLLRLTAGILTGVDYTAQVSEGGGSLDLSGFENRVNFSPAGNDTSAGLVDTRSWAEAPGGDVPTPATLALFGLGLISLAIHRRKRQTHA